MKLDIDTNNEQENNKKPEKINNILKLNDIILKEIKMSELLSEDTLDIKRLDSVKWKATKRKYSIAIKHSKNSNVDKIINTLVGERLFEDRTIISDIPTIQLKNSKIKNVYCIEKITDEVVEQLPGGGRETVNKSIYTDLADETTNPADIYSIEHELSVFRNKENLELIKNISFYSLHSSLREKSNSAKTNERNLISNADAIIVVINEKDLTCEKTKIDIINIIKDISKDDLEKIYFIFDSYDKVVKNTKQEKLIKDMISQILNTCNIPSHSLKLHCISSYQAELSNFIMKNVNNEVVLYGIIKDYREFFSAVVGSDKEEYSEDEIYKVSQKLFEISGFSCIKDDILENMFEKFSDRFIEETQKSIETVLENILSKVNNKINYLSRNSKDLFDISDDIKAEIKKMNIDDSGIELIAESEFKELELNIGYILKNIKLNLREAIYQTSLRERELSSLDKNSLITIIEDSKSNAIVMMQMILDRELEKIQRICMETQYKIYIESQYKLSMESQKKLKPMARDKFNEILKEFTKTTAEEYESIDTKIDIKENVNLFKSSEEYIYEDYQSDGTYLEKIFDPSGASIGTITGAIAGATVGGLLGFLSTGSQIPIFMILGMIVFGVVGFIYSSRKEIVREKESKVFKADMKTIKQDLEATLNKVTALAVKYTGKKFKIFKSKHIQFLSTDINKFLCCLDDESDNIINSQKIEINDMIDSKFKIEKYIEMLEKIKKM